MAQSIGPFLRQTWNRLSSKPGGKWLFSQAVGRFAPYTGSIGARITQLEPGFCQVKLRDRRRVRNHLHSVHAIALCNLGEVSTGLALMNSLPDHMRGILKGISVDFQKKARGTLTSESRCEVPTRLERQEQKVTAEIRNSDGETVAVITTHWLIGPESI